MYARPALSTLGLFTNTERRVVEYTLIDSLYFAFVTVTTVGYGDLTAQTQAGRFATTYYIVSVLFWLPSKVSVAANAQA